MSEAKTETVKNRIYRDPSLRIVFGITLMAVLGVASITPAFPKIMEELKISALDVGLLITVFTLPGILLTPILGILADRYGRKRVVIPALFLFSAAGVACFFATDFRVLLLLRFLQGIGGASLGAINVTIIGDLYVGKELTAAMGYNSTVLSVGTASYPAVGGALAMLGWNYPFLLPAFAFPIGILVLFHLNDPAVENRQNLREYFRGTWRTIKNLHVVGLFITGTVTFILLYGLVLAYLPVFLAGRFGASPLAIGLVVSAMSVSSATASALLEWISRRVPEKILMAAGIVLYAVSALLVPLSPNIWFVLIPSLLYGFGNGLNIPSFVALLTGFAPREHRAALMSLNGMVVRLGQTLGPIIMGAVFLGWGITAVFITGAAVAVALLALALVMVE